jgi:hypothetical protein
MKDGPTEVHCQAELLQPWGKFALWGVPLTLRVWWVPGPLHECRVLLRNGSVI